MPCVPRNPPVDPGVTRDAGAMRSRRHSRPPELRLRKSRRMNRRMGELFDTFLDREPRIALGINPATGSRLGHLFRGVSAECCRGQDAYKGNNSDDRDCAQRPPEMAIKTRPTWQHRFHGFLTKAKLCPDQLQCRSMSALRVLSGSFVLGASRPDWDQRRRQFGADLPPNSHCNFGLR